MKTKRILSGLLAGVFAAGTAFAFSLRGPTDAWQTAAIGYGVTALDDFGGPMNLGEEYRMNVPILTYGFDSTFLNYFGSNGMVAVEAAFKILNDIPHVSQMSASLGEFPLQSRQTPNFTAQSLGIQDIKSTVLGIMVAQMGLADPERFVWTLRDRQVGGNPSRTNYLVIKRNFDPTSLSPSSYVNTALYTYDIREFDLPVPYADAVEKPVDTQDANRFSSVARVDDGGGPSFSSTGLGAGDFYTGLTRDDIGGLRYLLRFNNYNVETMAAGVTLVPQPVSGVFGPRLNFGSSLFGPGGIQFSSPWGPTGTNTFATNAVGGTNALVATALRPGIGKVSFTKVQFDSLLYSSLNVTSLFTDTVITNSISTNQMVQRVMTVPDILFTAADLGVLVVAGVPQPILFTRSVLANYVNYAGLNGLGGVTAGPGVINPGGGAAPSITIAFSKLGPSFNNSTPFFLSEGNARAGNVWGYFDTTTIFSVFPDGTTVQDLENQVLGR